MNAMLSFSLLFLLMAQQSSQTPASREPAPQAQAQVSRQPTPAPSVPTTPAEAPGGRGRGGVPGPGPAVGGEIDETPVVTHHSISVGGKTINYTDTAAQMPLQNNAGE